MISKKDYSGLSEIFFLLTAIGGIVSLYLFTENISDSDSLYHIRHAWLYRTSGFFDSGFPWHQFSIARDAGSDLWYGFHILLTPFTYASDLLDGIKASGIFMSLFLIFSLYCFFKKIKVWHPALWVLFVVAPTTEMFYRMTSARPHVVSMALIALLFIFVVEAGEKRRRVIFLASLFISFIHLAMVWTVFLVVLAASVSEGIAKQKNALTIIIIDIMPAVFGAAIGFFFRPYFFGSLKLLYLQTFGIIFAKLAGHALPFGAELESVNFTGALRAGVFLAVLSAAVMIFIASHKKSSQSFSEEFVPVILSSLMLCSFFLLLSFLAVERAMDFVFFFGTAFIAVIYSEFLRNSPNDLKIKIQKTGIILIILIFGIYNMFSAFNYKEKYGHRLDVFKDAALWLLNNSNERDIVAHFNFLDSQKLFFWNQKNYYISGFDPIFQYSYDQKLYAYLEFSKFADFPFGSDVALADRKKAVTELHLRLIDNFYAKYLFMEKRYFTSLIRALGDSPGYKKVFESDGEIIYKIERI